MAAEHRGGAKGQSWIVWGRRDDHASGAWIKLAGGTLHGCQHEEKFRREQGWDTRLRTPGRPALDAGDLADNGEAE